METMPWKISIDTGGTFTDCLAHSPAGTRHTFKVLSSGVVLARMQVSETASISLILPFDLPTTLFRGYHLKLLAQEGLQEQELGRLQLDTDNRVSWPEGHPILPFGIYRIELSSGEVAPILAARLITRTPLQQILPPIDMRLGTTKGTNALLERKGARVALLVTKGFEDIQTIGNQQRTDLFSLDIQKPSPLSAHVLGVFARMNAQGEILEALSPEHCQDLVSRIKASGCDAVAISLMHSYTNPAHELQLEAACQAAGIQFVSRSSELSALIKFLPRLHTTLINAYLQPIMQAYLEEVSAPLPAQSLLVMTSAASLEQHDHYHPKDSLLSGPAGGIVGAAHIAERCGFSQFLTLDMGGTSTDVARYENAYSFQDQIRMEEFVLQSKAVAIHTVAAGGGSICHFDGQALRVGPESAGASPGPACYGKGGPLTLTDVAFLAGLMDPAHWSIPLDRAAAESALDQMVIQTGLSRANLIAGLLDIACETMANAIRVVSIQEGADPRAFALLAFGGAGGQYACRIAEKLGIDQIIAPREAGILSAIGMGVAPLVREARKAILQTYDQAMQEIPAWLPRLELLARQKLPAALQNLSEISVGVDIALRLKGQDHYLTVPFLPEKEIIPTFQNRYRRQYGYYPENHPIEVVYLAVQVRYQDSRQGDAIPPTPASSITAGHWDSISVGESISGPHLLSSTLGTLAIGPNWQATLSPSGDAILTRSRFPDAEPQKELQENQRTIALSLFTQRFKQVASEMGSLLARTSFSVNVKERLDFSCGLLDAQGFLVANAPHIPVHLGSLGLCTRLVMKALQLEEGDVALTNHPGFGGSHLPDITLIAPVHYQGKRIGFVANRAHHAEIGGQRPGSMPPDATRLIEEGVVFAPCHLVKGGVANWEEIKARLINAPYPSRALTENIADLHAALASIRAGQEQVISLCHRYGANTVSTYMQALQTYTAQRVREAWNHIPQGTYSAIEHLDDGTPLSVQFHHQGPGQPLRISFSGTGPTHSGNLNANPAIVYSVVAYLMRLLLEEDLPLNAGLLKGIEIDIPVGTILNPNFSGPPQTCPAVVGGNVETSQRLTDTMLKALQLSACSQGTMNNVLFGNDHFGYYETLGGGSGAGPGFNGADAVHQHMTNTRLTDPEVLEHRYPVLLVDTRIRLGSGGSGAFKGGDGLERTYRFLEPVTLTVMGQHRTEAPYGMRGGDKGAMGQQFLKRKNGERINLAGTSGIEAMPGDELCILSPGGGGWGSFKVDDLGPEKTI